MGNWEGRQTSELFSSWRMAFITFCQPSFTSLYLPRAGDGSVLDALQLAVVFGFDKPYVVLFHVSSER